jgi:hypothetical protein
MVGICTRSVELEKPRGNGTDGTILPYLNRSKESAKGNVNWGDLFLL